METVCAGGSGGVDDIGRSALSVRFFHRIDLIEEGVVVHGKVLCGGVEGIVGVQRGATLRFCGEIGCFVVNID